MDTLGGKFQTVVGLYPICTLVRAVSGWRYGVQLIPMPQSAEEPKASSPIIWEPRTTKANGALGNLLETFEYMEHIYSIRDLEDGICTKLFAEPEAFDIVSIATSQWGKTKLYSI